MTPFLKRRSSLSALGALVAAIFSISDAAAVSLVEAADFDGVIQDLSLDRMLYTSSSGVLTIEDRASGASTAVPAVGLQLPSYGYLVPGGAVYVAKGESVLDVGVYVYGNESVRRLGTPDAWSSVKVNGNYVIWNGTVAATRDTGNRETLSLYDVQSGKTRIVSTSAGNWGNGVSATGVVTYWGSNYRINRYADGSSRQLARDDALWDVLVASDGSLAVYRKQARCCLDQHYQIMLTLDGVETALTGASAFEPVPGRNYQVKGGWVAYTASDEHGVQQAWLRAPDGLQAQVSDGPLPAHLDLLGDNGQLTYLVDDVLYVAGHEAPLLGAFGVESRSFWLDDSLWLAQAGHLYAVNFEQTTALRGTSTSVVPLPTSACLLASCLGLLGFVRRPQGRPATR